jgi:hypothetical protein
MHDTQPTVRKSSPILKVAGNEISMRRGIKCRVVEMPGTLEEKGSYAGRTKNGSRQELYNRSEKILIIRLISSSRRFKTATASERWGS